MVGESLAHSAEPPTPVQTYREHVDHVRDGVVHNARAACKYYSGDSEALVRAVEAAALYHDLGKLDEGNQEVLRRSSHVKLPLPHEDAGVAELIRQSHLEAAVLVAAHHAGLFDKSEELTKRERFLRDVRVRSIGATTVIVAEHVDANLKRYVQTHEDLGLPVLTQASKHPIHSCGFARRVALSCLVDADYGDTARHYGREVLAAVPLPRWEERLSALDGYVARLPRTGSRDALRRAVYEACRSADTEKPVKACDAPVGSGKTTAVMANLLRAASRKQLRHIIVVLPYMNIIKQAVKVYREALTLPDENPTEVVAEHHHQADFGDIELRQLATLWRAPVIVTTAVQFFETLGSYHPARLRKLHELPGSAVFVDEAHAALPSPLWPQIWRWLETWCAEWSGYLVLASGSLPRFWQLKEFVSPPVTVPDLLPDDLRRRLTAAEGERIRYVPGERPMSPDELLEFVLDKPGPRLLIMNTVQSAAYIADRLRKQGEQVMHLSTALAPEDRELVVERVKRRLKSAYREWTLVATSCVEAGMDFSFRSGFRERATTASLIQVGGRVSRGAEHAGAVVWDFRAEGGLLARNPSMELARKVVQRMFESGQMNSLPAGELAERAMQGELTEKGREDARALKKAEDQMEYRKVGKLCRVIRTDTCLVVVSDSLARRIRGGERVTAHELQRSSVQVWTHKIKKRDLPLELLSGSEDEPDALYYWTAEYDPDFLGYMAGALPILEMIQTGVFVA